MNKRISITIWQIILPVLIFIILCIYRLSSVSFWLDEIMTIDFCDGSFTETIKELKNDVHAPFYYILLNVYHRIIPFTELTARLLSIAAGALTVFSVYYFCITIKRPGLAFFSSLMLAFSPFFIEFSREVHPYSLSALLSVLSWIFFVKLLQSRKKKFIFFHALSTGLLVLTFYPAVVMPLSQFILLFLMKISRRKKRRIIYSFMLSFAVFCLWIKVLVFQLSQDKIGVLERYFPEGITVSHIANNIMYIFLGKISLNINSALLYILAAGIIAISLLVLISNRKGNISGGFSRNRLNYLPVYCFWVPFIFFTLICVLKPVYIVRYQTMSAPFAVILLAESLLLIRKRIIAHFVVYSLVIIMIISYFLYLKSMPREDWKNVSGYLLENMRDSDVVVTEDMNANSCLVYYFFLKKRPEMMKNVFQYNTFYSLTKGIYKFPDRVLWYVSKKNNNEQIIILQNNNTKINEKDLGNGLKIYSYTKK